ncbi:MFS transporter [Chloroflexota bacterium]
MKTLIDSSIYYVTAIIGLGVLSMSILSPILPLYLTSIAITPEIIGLMMAVSMVGMAIGEPSAGWLADRIGIKTPLYIGTFGSGLMVLCLILSQNVAVTFVVYFLWGLVRSALYGPCRGYLGVKAPPSRRVTIMAIMTIVIVAARSFGALPSGFLADNWGYYSVFFVSAGVALLAGCIVLISIEIAKLVEVQPLPGNSSDISELPNNNHKSSLLSLSPQFIVAALQFMGLGILMTFGPLLATEVIGVRATEVGILFAIVGVCSMVMGIPIGMLTDRVGKKTFMILGMVTSGVAMGGIAYVTNYSSLVTFAVFNGLGFIMFTPAALALLSEKVIVSQQSTVMGIYGGLFENGGMTLGAAIGGFVWASWGPQLTFLTGSIASIIGAVICISFISDRPRVNIHS